MCVCVVRLVSVVDNSLSWSNIFHTLIKKVVDDVLSHLNVSTCVWNGIVFPIKIDLLGMPLEAVDGETTVFYGGHIFDAVFVGGCRNQKKVFAQTQILEGLYRRKTKIRKREKGEYKDVDGKENSF